MVVLDPGSPYDSINVFMTGADEFRVGQHVLARGTYYDSATRHWIQATSMTLVGASPSPSPTSTDGGPSPSPRPSATPRPSPTPHSGSVDHVIVIMMENKGRSEIVGNSQAPYVNSLLSRGADMTNSFDIGHPSEPNYEALYSGSVQGLLGTDSCPHTFSAPSLGGEAASFKWYAESMQGVGNPACWQGGNDPVGNAYYGRKHVVMFNHSDTPANDGVPYSQLAGDMANNTVPQLAFVSPNQCDDMHDACGGPEIVNGDAWLASNLPAMIAYADAHNGMVVLTWDEDDNGSGRITTLFIGPMIKIGSYNEQIDHYNVLATICQKLGLTNLGSSPVTDIFR